MNSLSNRWVVLLGTILVGSGCGGGGTGGSGSTSGGNGVGDPVQPVFDNPSVDRLMDSYCTYETRCGQFSNKRTCIQNLTNGRGRELADLASALGAGAVDYHQDLADQCASFALNAKCTVANLRAMSDICHSAFTGKTSEGGACHVSQECADNAGCLNDCRGSSCCQGKCGPARPKTTWPEETKVADGGSCYDTMECEIITSYCEPKRSTCQPRPAVGAKCKIEYYEDRSFDPCAEYAICWAGVCKRKPEIGESCLDPDSGPCQIGTCDEVTNKCTIDTTITRCF